SQTGGNSMKDSRALKLEQLFASGKFTREQYEEMREALGVSGRTEIPVCPSQAGVLAIHSNHSPVIGDTAGGTPALPGDWPLLVAVYAVVALIFFLFTPYTHQLDEIKNVILYS